jgi:hypothetical protein
MHQWLTPIILATQEAEKMRRISDRNQAWEIVLKTLSQKCPLQKRAGGVPA